MSASFSSNDTAVLTKVAEIEGEVIKTPSDILEGTYDLEKCVKWIDDKALEKVCLQFPDCLLPDSVEIALRLENASKRQIYILGDTSCGSCCVDEVAAQHVDGSGIIHFGHACLNPTSRLPVFHVLPKGQIDARAFCHKFGEHFQDRAKKILLFYDIVYAHEIESIYTILKQTFKNLILTTLNCTSNVEFTDAPKARNILVLGRNYKLENGYRIEDYEAVFLGKNGKTLAKLAMSIPSKVWYHSKGDEIKEFTVLNSLWLKRRRFLVEKLKDARIVGIVVATLGIQDYLEAISAVKRALKAKNKKSYILSVGKPNPAKLANFPEMDAFVVIACAENDIFDSREYFKPILTPFEVELAFNTSREFSTQYCMDFRQILPGGTNYVDFQASDDSDVSLISGDIRHSGEDAPSAEKMGALVCKPTGAVAIGKGGANFLLNRSWQGLEQRLGQDDVSLAEKGRSGLPVSYENEPISKTS